MAHQWVILLTYRDLRKGLRKTHSYCARDEGLSQYGKYSWGIEELKIDVNKNKPGTQLIIDRKKAGDVGRFCRYDWIPIEKFIFGAKAGIYKKDGEKTTKSMCVFKSNTDTTKMPCSINS